MRGCENPAIIFDNGWCFGVFFDRQQWKLAINARACGEWNSVIVDESAGRQQSYVEDCQVCCKPNVLRAHYDATSQEFFITAELE
jgi:Cysteine-rich CPXCG